MKRLVRVGVATTLTAVVGAALASSAGATYHENLIREVHQGVGDTGDFVELQAYASGQNFVAGRHVITYDGGGTPFGTVTFPANVSNGANQATILVAHDSSVPGADVIDPGLKVVNTGGYVCFTDVSTTAGLDCVGYGPSSVALAPVSPVGTRVAPAGLGDGQSIERSIARGCPTLLDLPDDSDNSVADFALAAPSPRGNAAAPTETPCPSSPAKKKKCKKKKHRSAESAKKKKCKKKKKR